MTLHWTQRLDVSSKRHLIDSEIALHSSLELTGLKLCFSKSCSFQQQFQPLWNLLGLLHWQDSGNLAGWVGIKRAWLLGARIGALAGFFLSFMCHQASAMCPRKREHRQEHPASKRTCSAHSDFTNQSPSQEHCITLVLSNSILAIDRPSILLVGGPPSTWFRRCSSLTKHPGS